MPDAATAPVPRWRRLVNCGSAAESRSLHAEDEAKEEENKKQPPLSLDVVRGPLSRGLVSGSVVALLAVFVPLCVRRRLRRPACRNSRAAFRVGPPGEEGFRRRIEVDLFRILFRYPFFFRLLALGEKQEKSVWWLAGGKGNEGWWFLRAGRRRLGRSRATRLGMTAFPIAVASSEGRRTHCWSTGSPPAIVLRARGVGRTTPSKQAYYRNSYPGGGGDLML